MAALLHDTVEDTDVTEEDLYAEFPEEVVYVVMELTDDKSKPKANRKELQVQKAATLSPEAKIVKLVDLWDNCSGLILQNQTWPWDDKRVSKYVAWAYQLHDEIVSSPAHLQNRSSKYTINDVDPVSYTKGAKRKTVTNYRALIDVAAKELVKVLKQY
jgi:(p)ppGpp synthase/HD superfamily hydrolase